MAINRGVAVALLSCEAMHELSQRFAESEQVSKVLRSEIRACARRCLAFAADLDDADDFAVGKNRRADDLLDGFQAFAGRFYVFENHCMAGSAEIIVNFRAAPAHRFCREGGVAGERNETHILQRFRYEKMQMFPSGRYCQDRY